MTGIVLCETGLTRTGKWWDIHRRPSVSPHLPGISGSTLYYGELRIAGSTPVRRVSNGFGQRACPSSHGSARTGFRSGKWSVDHPSSDAVRSEP